MKRILCVMALCLTFSAFAKKQDDGSQIQPDNYYPVVKIITSMGDITVELDRRRAPITVNNFLRYVDKRSYEDTIIHRIVPNYVIQGGGYDEEYNSKPEYPDIFNESGNGLKNDTYSISMARQNEPHTANRQFFFNMKDNTNLDPGSQWGYAVFGRVTDGESVLDAMNEVETEYKVLEGFADAPIENIVIKKIEILPAY